MFNLDQSHKQVNSAISRVTSNKKIAKFVTTRDPRINESVDLTVKQALKQIADAQEKKDREVRYETHRARLSDIKVRPTKNSPYRTVAKSKSKERPVENKPQQLVFPPLVADDEAKHMFIDQNVAEPGGTMERNRLSLLDLQEQAKETHELIIELHSKYKSPK